VDAIDRIVRLNERMEACGDWYLPKTDDTNRGTTAGRRAGASQTRR